VAVPIGELAHNVGWGDGSPRGDSQLDDEQRRSSENLILLCRNCHKPTDDGGVIGHFSAEKLSQLKRDHEERIKFLTSIGGDRLATIVRVVGTIRGLQPELTYDTVLEATTAAGLFPKLLAGSFRAECESDLRTIANPGLPSYFAVCAEQIDALIDRVNDGIRRDEVVRLAVFGFARIPVLVHLGARLGDKVPAIVFQRQRVDDVSAWTWPEPRCESVAFVVEEMKGGSEAGGVSLVVNLSGVVTPAELPLDRLASDTVYVLKPAGSASPGPAIVSSPETLADFDRALRRFLVDVETKHGKPSEVHLFPAVPVSAAIAVGRVLMPDISPAWRVYDRDDAGRFFEALTVRS
jgi:hypothetical protein